VCSAKYGSFLEFIDFMFSCYVAHVFSKWLWNIIIIIKPRKTKNNMANERVLYSTISITHNGYCPKKKHMRALNCPVFTLLYIF